MLELLAGVRHVGRRHGLRGGDCRLPALCQTFCKNSEFEEYNPSHAGLPLGHYFKGRYSRRLSLEINFSALLKKKRGSDFVLNKIERQKNISRVSP